MKHANFLARSKTNALCSSFFDSQILCCCTTNLKNPSPPLPLTLHSLIAVSKFLVALEPAFKIHFFTTGLENLPFNNFCFKSLKNCLQKNENFPTNLSHSLSSTITFFNFKLSETDSDQKKFVIATTTKITN